MNDSQVPQSADVTGRAPNGKFTKGNRCGTGNPLNKRAAQLRSAMLRTVKPSDLADIIKKLIELAKDGDIAAAKLVLERTLGKQSMVDSVPVDVPQDQQSEGERRQKALAKLKGAGLTLVSDNDESDQETRHVS